MTDITISTLRKPAALLLYRTMTSPFTTTDPIPDAFSYPLVKPYMFHATHPASHQISDTLQLPYHLHHNAFQYVQLWQELQPAIAHDDKLLPDDIIANEWAQTMGHFYGLWQKILQANHYTILTKQFFSLLHCLGSDLTIPPVLCPVAPLS